MGRSRIITDKQILEAAREVFLAEGFGASTVEIARRAGVSEGSIFKRFSTKEKLFFAAMSEASSPQWVKTLNALIGQGDLKQNLIALSQQVIECLREFVPRIIMARSKGLLSPALVGLDEPPLARDLKALTDFFDEEMKLGRIRAGNPEVPARILLGTLTNHVLMEKMAFSTSDVLEHPNYLEELIDSLLEGIAHQKNCDDCLDRKSVSMQRE
ncbi:TetR/AcrR family transcriptional regulator [Thermocoleostomius sinensis]|jgi:AcrR family transcriptional regulator|uniref:TetR/AcrR family transcriptional regulator n=1 Tax=Thermocoleostomius sinensis A174 TaxID=2016057 RepID=A0A9E8ZFE6_9CYAN|nr:TetR/AcrR family transcriptional regulator [Thermocoleostomius sinensis]WAL60839.1 TetR/AcrR family transcriptional regulator [Thermocoleostomius sinensis A174]